MEISLEEHRRKHSLCSPQSGIERGTKHEHTWVSDVDREI